MSQAQYVRKVGKQMKATVIHRCTHVLDLDKTLAFYKEALGFDVIHAFGPPDGSWSNTFIGNGEDPFEIELTWNNGRTEPYNNGSDDTHLAVQVDDFEEAHALHEKMGCIVCENESLGVYFIADPDGCWIEILPPVLPEPKFD